MENFDNETIIKNINEFKLLITTQKQYVLNTQHENSLKTLELKYKDDEIKKLKDKSNKNYIKKKVYENKNKMLEEENKNLKNQVDFLKNLILLNNTNINKSFLNHPIDYELVADVYKDTLPDIGEIEVKPIPTFKFAGGWFTLISKDLLIKTDIPESLGHYGLEDTYIMLCSQIMKQKGMNVIQFVLENEIIVGDDLFRFNPYKNYLSIIDKREEFKQMAHKNFQNEINKFGESINK
jgi:hypothetical protein